MQNTQDLAGIVNLIMQNPSLIEQISALANQKVPPTSAEAKSREAESAAEEAEQVGASPTPLMRSHRHELLNAMKPYLSETRRTAIDSMASILDVIDVMIKKG